MKPVIAFVIGACFLAAVVIASVASTQQNSSLQSRELNFREYTALLRADIKSQRTAIITQLMEFNEDEAAGFWPIFKQYDAELAKIGDSRLNLIEDYAQHFDNLTNEKADELMAKAFGLEAERAMLKKRYFDKMKTAISATQAAKFFQIENQMQYLIDLQISALLPTVQTTSN